jgi:drug/metabolite transporter (DMT)-like permease
MRVHVIALACVFGIAAGQVLFKLCANASRIEGLWATKTLLLFAAAMALYGTTTLAWIWVLQRAELGKIYPLMALAFVFVPLAGYWLFGERFSISYAIGIALIVAGIWQTTRG